jgi:hypothetical protein
MLVERPARRTDTTKPCQGVVVGPGLPRTARTMSPPQKSKAPSTKNHFVPCPLFPSNPSIQNLVQIRFLFSLTEASPFFRWHPVLMTSLGKDIETEAEKSVQYRTHFLEVLTDTTYSGPFHVEFTLKV